MAQTNLRHKAMRLTTAILDVIAALPLALVLAALSAQLVFDYWPANSEVPLTSAVVIVVVLVWVALMLVLTIVIWLRPLLIVGAIPLAYLLNGYPISRNQVFVALGLTAIFLVLTRLIRRLSTPILALATVLLSYGLYLFPPLQGVFTSHTTATVAWFIALLLCWALLSVPVNLVEKALHPAPQKRPEPEQTQKQPGPAPAQQEDPIQRQLTERLKRIQAEQDSLRKD